MQEAQLSNRSHTTNIHLKVATLLTKTSKEGKGNNKQSLKITQSMQLLFTYVKIIKH